ncbi:MAG: hypothetical protein Q7S04_04690 [Candidatus Moranbacteria bacterium]|nr:hypothetical protein [Candidatus Moranbacteria bacterium]
MFDKKIITVLVGALVLVTGFVYWGLSDGGQTVVDDETAIVYYWGDGCPHCKIVSDFLEANDIASKVSFEKKEVWSNKTNASEMGRRAKACGVKPEGMGVPFVYGGDGKCYIGEVDAVNFFKVKSGMSTDTSSETQR